MDLKRCKRILIFGGSFDPPHLGHTLLPMLAMEAVGADGIAYVPAAKPPHKEGVMQSAASHRLQMLQLAVKDQPFAEVSALEFVRAARIKGPTYTIDTLIELREQLGPGPEFRLLIGGDMLRSFDSWRSPEQIIELAEPAVMVRPPDTPESLLDALPTGFDRAEWAPRLIPLPQIELSSTLIRERIRAGKPISGMVLPAVEQFIYREKLFQ